MLNEHAISKDYDLIDGYRVRKTSPCKAKFSRRARLLILLGASTASWSVIAAIAYCLVKVAH